MRGGFCTCPQVMQLFGPSYGGGGGGAGAAAGAGAGGGGGATLASSGRCRYKGGTTVDVSVGYHTFEVTSFRGGTRDPGEEAEWRDAGAGMVWCGAGVRAERQSGHREPQ